MNLHLSQADKQASNLGASFEGLDELLRSRFTDTYKPEVCVSPPPLHDLSGTVVDDTYFGITTTNLEPVLSGFQACKN